MINSAAQSELYIGTAHFKEANEMIRSALESSDVLALNQVYAQRYIGCTMRAGKRLEIHGTPGNDMACYMDGGEIEVYGNAQDQIGNTMNDGLVIVHGRCGDAAGYAMRGGEVFVRDDCGWRVGIHMKQYQDKKPTIVVGGNAGSFLGEYMAGGIIVLMGHPGEYLATGMHGGTIYLRNHQDVERVSEELVLTPVDDQDRMILHNLLTRYNSYFEGEVEPVDTSGQGYYRLCPASSRPYASMYVN